VKGRPLRFLVAALGIWGMARGVALWPVDEIADAIGSPAPIAAAAAATMAMIPKAPGVTPPGRRTGLREASTAPGAPPARQEPSSPSVADAPIHDPRQRAVPALKMQDEPPTMPPPVAPSPIASGGSRLHGSVWGIVRGGSSAALLGGQLGASQAGVRLTYALGASRRVALAARLSTPLDGDGREAAIGIDWQPLAVPVHLIAERRFSLGGGRGGIVVGVIGGFGPTPVGGAWHAEGYAQTGGIRRDAVEGFADGSLRLTRSLVDHGQIRVDIGAGAWGGVQRGARRLDVGPTVGVWVPVGARQLRLTADWRARIGGDARPGSGPAVSVGSDF
jgi:hypothetical protein